MVLGYFHHGDPHAVGVPELAKGRMRVKIPQLTEALTGHFDEGHGQLARSMLARIDAIEAALAELNRVIAEAFRPWDRQMALLQSIPGVGENIARSSSPRTGADMTRFPTQEHLVGGLA